MRVRVGARGRFPYVLLKIARIRALPGITASSVREERKDGQCDPNHTQAKEALDDAMAMGDTTLTEVTNKISRLKATIEQAGRQGVDVPGCRGRSRGRGRLYLGVLFYRRQLKF